MSCDFKNKNQISLTIFVSTLSFVFCPSITKVKISQAQSILWNWESRYLIGSKVDLQSNNLVNFSLCHTNFSQGFFFSPFQSLIFVFDNTTTMATKDFSWKKIEKKLNGWKIIEIWKKKIEKKKSYSGNYGSFMNFFL